MTDTPPPHLASTSGAPTPRWVLVVLGILLVASFALRLWVSWPNPGPKRFWDEQYLTANTARALTQGWTHSQNVYYPGLGHFPATAVLAAGRTLGWLESEDAATSPRQMGSTGYRVARTLNVAWGVAGLGLLFLLGSALSGYRLGLIAALILAVVPWHLRQSVLFKPDIALCTLVTASLLTSVRLLPQSSHGPASRLRWIAAWASAALAVSAKWNAAPLLVPLLWASGARLRHGDKKDIRSCLLGIAAGSALLIALNPSLVLDPGAYSRDLSETATHYRGRAANADASRFQMPLHAVQSMASADYLGPWLAILGAAGLVLVSRELWSRREPRSAWLVPLIWTVVYVAVYTVATAYASPHNWLPILPVVALGTAFALAQMSEITQVNTAARWLFVGLATLVLAERARSVGQLSVREAVPTTAQVAEGLILARLDSFEGRTLLSEVPLHDRLQSFAVQSRTLDPKQPRLLNVTAPADTRPEEWPDTFDGRVWLRRGEECPATALAIEPRPFRVRGQPLCLALHPRARSSILEGLELDPREKATRLGFPAGTENDDLFSIDLQIGLRSGTQPARPEIVAMRGGEEERLVCSTLRSNQRRMRCRTPRFEKADDLVVHVSGEPRRVALWLYSWGARRGSSTPLGEER